jgi:hypothetical protein
MFAREHAQIPGDHRHRRAELVYRERQQFRLTAPIDCACHITHYPLSVPVRPARLFIRWVFAWSKTEKEFLAEAQPFAKPVTRARHQWHMP